jgi:hypothetical protein
VPALGLFRISCGLGSVKFEGSGSPIVGRFVRIASATAFGGQVPITRVDHARIAMAARGCAVSTAMRCARCVPYVAALPPRPPELEARVSAWYAALTPLARLRIAAGLYGTARAIIASSPAPELPEEEHRHQIAKRRYGDGLPEIALRAHARYVARPED